MAIGKFSELDNLLKHLDEGYAISHDEAYRRFAESHLLPLVDPRTQLKASPVNSMWTSSRFGRFRISLVA